MHLLIINLVEIMIIEKFCIKNFKSIKHSTDVKLEDDLTIIIGKNEAGKTSLLKALESFRTDYNYKDNDLSFHSDDNKKHGSGNLATEDIPMTTIYFKIEDSDRIKLEEIDPTFKDINILKCTKYFDDHYEIEIPELNMEFNGNQVAATKKEIENHMHNMNRIAKSFKDELESVISNTPYTTFQDDFQALLNKIIKFDDLEKINELDFYSLKEVVPDDERISVPLDNFINKIKIQIGCINKLQKESDDIFSQIISILPNFIYFSTIEELDDEASWTELKTNKKKYKTLWNLIELSDLNFDEIQDLEDRNILTDVRNASAKITGLVNESWKQEKLELDIYVTKEKVVISIHDEVVNKFYNPSVRSQGFQWFLSFYINFSVGSKKEFKNTIILLDDPGVYLHASGQKDLIRTLEKISESNQIIISTHSPFLINPNKMERIRIATKDKTHGTIISDKFYNSNYDAYAPLRASIGMTLGDSLFFNKKTLMVEGITDDIFMRPMSDLLSKESENFINTSEIAVLSFNGADRAKYFIPFLLDEKIQFLVLLDHDEKGRDVATDLEATFGENLKIITYGDLENLGTGDIEIEDLFDFEFYLKAVNLAYKDIFKEKLGFEELKSDEIQNKSFRGIKNYFRTTNGISRLNKVLVAKKIAEMIKNNDVPSPETISNFSNLFKMINDKFQS